jgi:dihydrolipoamide dehydrogenase
MLLTNIMMPTIISNLLESKVLDLNLIFSIFAVSGLSIDVAKMMQSKDKKVAGLTSGIEYLFKKYGVTYVKGKGTLTSPNNIKVALNEGGSQEIKTKNVLIATGSEVAHVPHIKVNENLSVNLSRLMNKKLFPLLELCL